MIQLKQVTLQRGQKILLQETDLTIYAGEKIGLIGANGAGKTSLFGLLQKENQLEQGEMLLPADLSISHIRQEMPSGDMNPVEYTLEGNPEYFTLNQRLAEAEKNNDGMAISDIHQRLSEIDGYALPSKAAKILLGLGFSQAELLQPVKSFSGGWRMRLNLAQVLIASSDLLLLDEPTNHLDLESIVWLEEWLQKSTQTILIISHDREFLDNVIHKIVHLNERKLTSYTGNYSDFERLRAEKLALQQASFEKQERQRAHLQKFVDRFRAKASKAKQAQSRMKMLDKMEMIEQVQTQSPFRFEFKAAQKLGDPIVRFHDVNIGYGDTTILNHVSCSIRANDRIGLIGPNGAGKSTLIKLFAGELTEQVGEVSKNNKLRVGYFAQHQLEQLSGDEGCMAHLLRIDPSIPESTARRFFGGFHFQGDRVFEPVRIFSGGEKARLVLALLIWQAPDIILLDEPTNHLDVEMREALNLALQQFDGAMVLVSHDRFLLSSVTDEFWLVADGNVKRFDGDLNDYRDWFFARMQNLNAEKAEKVKKAPPSNPLRLQADLKKMETKLGYCDAELAKLDVQLSNPELYQNPDIAELEKLQTRRKQKTAEKEKIEAEILLILQKLE